MTLSDTAIRNAKPKDKPYRLSDGAGMYLLVTTKGGKWWRFDYRINGKRKTISFGIYPDIKLKTARERRNDARELVAKNIDPSLEKRIQKAKAGTDTFEEIAREWFEKHKINWVETHSGRIFRRLEKDVFPWIGKLTIKDVTAPVLLDVLRRIEKRGALETTHRIHQNCGQIFRYAIATGRAERDPSQDLRGAIPPAKPTHFPSIIEPKKIGELLRVIDGYTGSMITLCALKLAPLVFVRPGELRHAEWSEINLEEKEWRIPAEKMKMRSPHIVPLSTQAISILEEIFPLTGNNTNKKNNKYVFPGVRSQQRPMSENTVNAALRRLGYDKTEMTGHGFRSIASTRLNEMGWNRDAIERQLAHSEKDGVRAAYNYAEHLDERRKMMQEWANYLHKLKEPS